MKVLQEGFVEKWKYVTFCLYTLVPVACEDEAIFFLTSIAPSLQDRTGILIFKRRNKKSVEQDVYNSILQTA